MTVDETPFNNPEPSGIAAANRVVEQWTDEVGDHFVKTADGKTHVFLPTPRIYALYDIEPKDETP